MFGDVVGYAVVANTLNPDKVNYPFGLLREIAGREFPVLERNRDGDCLCIVDGKAIADICAENIVSFR